MNKKEVLTRYKNKNNSIKQSYAFISTNLHHLFQLLPGITLMKLLQQDQLKSHQYTYQSNVDSLQSCNKVKKKRRSNDQHNKCNRVYTDYVKNPYTLLVGSSSKYPTPM
jgi:hypothetical protein